MDLKALLQKAYDDIVEIRNMYEELRKDKEILMKQWASRYCDQHKRIQAVIDIALLERESVYTDIESLIRDNDRFSLENLLNYTPQTWLSNRNQVIIKFIETLLTILLTQIP